MATAAAQDEGVLSQFDFSAIEEMDPSLSGGHRVIYDREVPFELRVQQVSEVPQEVGTLEAVRVATGQPQPSPSPSPSLSPSPSPSPSPSLQP